MRQPHAGYFPATVGKSERSCAPSKLTSGGSLRRPDRFYPNTLQANLSGAPNFSCATRTERRRGSSAEFSPRHLVPNVDGQFLRRHQLLQSDVFSLEGLGDFGLLGVLLRFIMLKPPIPGRLSDLQLLDDLIIGVPSLSTFWP